MQLCRVPAKALPLLLLHTTQHLLGTEIISAPLCLELPEVSLENQLLTSWVPGPLLVPCDYVFFPFKITFCLKTHLKFMWVEKTFWITLLFLLNMLKTNNKHTTIIKLLGNSNLHSNIWPWIFFSVTFLHLPTILLKKGEREREIETDRERWEREQEWRKKYSIT